MGRSSVEIFDQDRPTDGDRPRSGDTPHGAGSSPGDDPDVGFMLEAAAGSDVAFAELIHRHQGALLNFFRRMGAYHDGEDLVQETFVRLHRFRARYRPSAKFRTFLYVLARHVWADRCRRTTRRERVTHWIRTAVEVDEAAPEPVVPAAAMDAQTALDRLSPKLREVLVLNVYQGLRYQEIADALGVPLGTVKSRINLALATIRRLLDET